MTRRPNRSIRAVAPPRFDPPDRADGLDVGTGLDPGPQDRQGAGVGTGEQVGRRPRGRGRPDRRQHRAVQERLRASRVRLDQLSGDPEAITHLSQASLNQILDTEFTSDALHDPRAASVFLDRLSRGGESDEVRAALVEALPRTGGTYADAAIDLLANETSAMVRGSYVFAARRAPAAQAIVLIKRGLADAAPEVQAEAARSAAAHPSGKQLAPELRATLASSDPAVKSS